MCSPLHDHGDAHAHDDVRAHDDVHAHDGVPAHDDVRAHGHDRDSHMFSLHHDRDDVRGHHDGDDDVLLQVILKQNHFLFPWHSKF